MADNLTKQMVDSFSEAIHDLTESRIKMAVDDMDKISLGDEDWRSMLRFKQDGQPLKAVTTGGHNHEATSFRTTLLPPEGDKSDVKIGVFFEFPVTSVTPEVKAVKLCTEVIPKAKFDALIGAKGKTVTMRLSFIHLEIGKAKGKAGSRYHIIYKIGTVCNHWMREEVFVDRRFAESINEGFKMEETEIVKRYRAISKKCEDIFLRTNDLYSSLSKKYPHIGKPLDKSIPVLLSKLSQDFTGYMDCMSSLKELVIFGREEYKPFISSEIPTPKKDKDKAEKKRSNEGSEEEEAKDKVLTRSSERLAKRPKN